MDAIPSLFPKAAHMSELLEIMEKTVRFAQQPDLDDLSAIHSLGEGWVAEETLAISVYCALRYADAFERAIVTSVNHSGDSDSTGAVTGNILGAFLGYDRLPAVYLRDLEFKEIILEIAEDLCFEFPQQLRYCSIRLEAERQRRPDTYPESCPGCSAGSD